MMRLSQVLGLVLALALGLASSEAPAPAASLSASLAHARGQQWLEVLRDTSMPMSERLQVAVSEPSVMAWVKAIAEHAPPVDRSTFDQLLRSPLGATQPTDPFEVALDRCIRGFAAGYELIEWGGVQAQVEQAELLDESLDLSEVLTDPTIPMIVGDELASFFEGLVALFAIIIVEDSEPQLAQELALAGADRLERTPRMVVLCGLEGYFELREDWERHLSDADLETLERDRAASKRYVAGLSAIAEHETSA